MSASSHDPARTAPEAPQDAPDSAITPGAELDRAPAARTVLHPATGEVLDLEAADNVDLADQRIGAVELRRLLDEFTATLDAEVIRRMDHENTLTLRAGPWKMTGDGTEVTTWDSAQLSLELEALVQAGRLARGAAQKALEVVVSYKPKAAELKKLAKHADPEVRTAVEACRTVGPNPRRRVRVALDRGTST